MNTIFDYYVMLNYIVYKFYRRHEDKDGSTISACGVTALLFSLPLCSIHGFLCVISPEFQLTSRQCNR